MFSSKMINFIARSSIYIFIIYLHKKKKKKRLERDKSLIQMIIDERLCCLNYIHGQYGGYYQYTDAHTFFTIICTLYIHNICIYI